MEDCMIYDPKDVFSTSDFDTIVVLMYFGVPVADMESDGRRVTFHFQEPDRCKQLYLDHLNNKLEVQTNKFINTITTVKSTVMQLKEHSF